MVNHGQQSSQTSEEDELSQEETTPQTYDDKLANLYKDWSSQNEFTKNLIIALSLKGISYGKEVIDAYVLLRKNLDPERLIKDQAYKKRVERAVQLVKRHEGKRLKTGKSKYTATIQRTEDGLKWTRFAHERIENVKKSLSSQYSIDMRRVYGFGDEEIKAISQGALERIKERPGLSMQEAMRIEARIRSLRRKIETEVNKEEKYNNFIKRLRRRKERDEEIKKRITAHEEEFIKRTSNIRELEKELTDKRIEEGTKHVSSSLGVEYKPTIVEKPVSTVAPIPQPQPPPTPQAVQPQAIPTTPISPPSPPAPQPLTTATAQAAQPSVVPSIPIPQPQPPSPAVAISEVTAPPRIVTPPFSPPSSIPSSPSPTPLPSVSPPSSLLSRIISPFKSLLGGSRGGTGNILGGFWGGLFSKGLNLLKNIGLKGAAAIAPPVAAALTALSAIDTLTGGLISRYATLAIAGIILVAVGIPIAISLFGFTRGIRLFSSLLSKNPQKASLDNKIYTWREFEKKFLASPKESLYISWQQFEKENLIPDKEYLSKNQEKE